MNFTFIDYFLGKTCYEHNKSTIFGTFGPLVWKRVGLKYLKTLQNLYRIIILKFKKDRSNKVK